MEENRQFLQGSDSPPPQLWDSIIALQESIHLGEEITYSSQATKT